MNRWWTGRVAMACIFLARMCLPAAAAEPLPGAADDARFVLTEMFGVSHPDQILTFDLARPVDPQRTVLVTDDGSEVAYQLVDGGKQLAVRTGLAAGARRTFVLRPGTPAARVADAVTTKETADAYEIANGLIGVRIPKAVNIADTQQLPAPIQGLLLRDGQWYGRGPNWLDYQSAADWTRKTVATGMTVKILERGPLTTVVQVDYRFEHPELLYGQTSSSRRARATTLRRSRSKPASRRCCSRRTPISSRGGRSTCTTRSGQRMPATADTIAATPSTVTNRTASATGRRMSAGRIATPRWN
jgi:hypothetical protein